MIQDRRGLHSRRFYCLFTAASISLLCLAGRATAQSQDASIIGQVTDDSGAVLPGVTVSATSTALQVPQVSAVTDGRGEYRLAPLPIGTYAITYTLQGFSTVKKENVRLTVGFVAKIDVALKVGALEETITVSGAAPTVDVTSTTTTTQLTKEALELVPSTRNGLTSLLVQAPALRGILDIGGSNFSAVPSFHVYGQDGQQWTNLEGVQTNDSANSGSGQYWDYTTFEETRVSVIGKSVEVPTRSVAIDAIVKSGGNNPHGSGFFGGTRPSMQATNIDDGLAAQGLKQSAESTQWDASGDFGGRIVRDKLWFYGATRYRQLRQSIPGAFQDAAATIPATDTQRQRFFTGKLSYQATKHDRFVGFVQDGKKSTLGSNVTVFVPWETRDRAVIPTATRKIEWQAVHGNVVTSLQYGYWYYNSQHFGFTDAPATQDLTTQRITGGLTSGGGSGFISGRRHTKGSVNWYKMGGSLGNHSVKAGFDYMAAFNSTVSFPLPQGDYRLVFRNNVPFELIATNAPAVPTNLDHYTDIYAADSWTLARRLTLDLGLRFDNDASFNPPQCQAAGQFVKSSCIDRISLDTWRSIVPRVSAAYDVTGNGRTAIKLGWGRYDQPHNAREVQAANPLAPVSTTYLWHDLNNDHLYQPGEVNLDGSGPDFVTQAGTAQLVPTSDQPRPTEDQYFLSFERQVISDMAIRVTGLYTRYFNVPQRPYVARPFEVYTIPVTNPDPGPDGKLATADDPGTSLTYYEYPKAYSGAQFEKFTMTSLPDDPPATYKTFEVAANKRQSNGWLFSASFSGTWSNVPFPENSFWIPNTLINSEDKTWEWTGRLSGGYRLPKDISLSATMENRSGSHGARTVLLAGGATIPSFLMRVEPLGTLDLPAIHNLDVRAEKAFSLGRGQKATIRLNAFNVTNANTITGWTTQSGANYLRPTSILAPRSIELGGSYTF